MAYTVGSAARIGFIAETVPGTTPATPSLAAIHKTEYQLDPKFSSFAADTIRYDGNVEDIYFGNKTFEGKLTQELRFGEADPLFESLFMSTFSSNNLVNGVTQKFFTFEEDRQDVASSDRYTVSRGVTVTALKLSFPSDLKPVKAEWTLKALSQAVPTTTSVDSNGYATEATIAPFVGTAVVYSEGGSTIAYFTDFNIEFSNGSKELTALGSASPIGINRDNFTAKISGKAYHPDGTLRNKFLSNTSTIIQVVMTIGANSYTILFPKVRYNSMELPLSGSGIRELSFEGTAVFDSATGGTAKISRV